MEAAAQHLGKELAREISMCLQYYGVTFRQRRPNACVLLGGGASEPALVQALTSESGITFEPLQTSDEGFNWVGQLGETAPAGMFAVAAGLSMQDGPAHESAGAAKMLNFTPDSVMQARARRPRLIRAAALSGALLALMVGWVMWSWQQIDQLDEQLAGLRQQTATKNQQSVLARRKQHRALRDDLKAPVPVSSAIATIAELMPASMGLTQWSWTAPPAEPKPLKKTRSRKRRRGPEQVPTIKLSLTGMAPNDLAIARLIGRLDERPLFANVELVYSQALETDELMARQFQITAQVPLNRPYQLQEPQAEVAHAD